MPSLMILAWLGGVLGCLRGLAKAVRFVICAELTVLTKKKNETSP